MSTKRQTDKIEVRRSANSLSFPAQKQNLESDELDSFVDSFIDLIIDDFIAKYRSGQLDVSALKKKGAAMLKK